MQVRPRQVVTSAAGQADQASLPTNTEVLEGDHPVRGHHAGAKAERGPGQLLPAIKSVRALQLEGNGEFELSSFLQFSMPVPTPDDVYHQAQEEKTGRKEETPSSKQII